MTRSVALFYYAPKRESLTQRARLFEDVIRLGFEPKTHSLEGCCSIQLSYQTITFRLQNYIFFRFVKEFLEPFFSIFVKN